MRFYIKDLVLSIESFLESRNKLNTFIKVY
jgi:hypothetical protein